MVLADIDHFKRVNDRYGHGAGDAVLGRIAGVLRPELRSGDLLCRYGGEEFAMVLPDTDNAGALVILERLRGIIAETDFAPVFPEALTMSFGVAEWNRALTDPPAWIEAADSALYAAKRRGRNRVVVFGVSGADGTRSRREFFSSRLRDEPSG
jgi:diguanylate cyclase (GGDEF)-like protein